MKENKVSEEIKKLIAEKNLNQTKLAKSLDITQSMVGQWIRGERPISVSVSIAIEKIYGTDASILNNDVKMSRESMTV